MTIGDRAFARIGGDDRRRQHLRQRGKPVAGFGVMHALPGPQQRMLGREQHFDGFLDGGRIGRGALHWHRAIIEVALEFRLKDLVRHLDQHRPGFARAHGVVGAPHQVGQLRYVMRERRPLGDRAVNVGGAEYRAYILPRQRQAAGNNEKGNVLGIGLSDAGEGVLDARPGLGGEHAIALAALDAGIAVGNADADALLTAQDRANVDRRARFDHGIAWITGKELRTLALENFGNDFGAIHGFWLPGSAKSKTR